MKNKKTLIKITEQNVDGCGTNASALLWIDLPENEAERAVKLSELKHVLNKIKNDARRDDACLDTDEMIEQALDNLGLSAKDVECFYADF